MGTLGDAPLRTCLEANPQAIERRGQFLDEYVERQGRLESHIDANTETGPCVSHQRIHDSRATAALSSK